MKNRILFILILLYNRLTFSIHSVIIYPALFNVAKYKPISIYPIGSSCGLDAVENLCDNRFTNVSSCIQVRCEQICPFGKVFSGTIDQFFSFQFLWLF